jgi:divalent metal cation (Fe/Co/Zn/Cd) transporter
MDPINTADPLVGELRERITGLLAELNGAVGVHDLRIVRGEQRINIIFDVVLSPDACSREAEILEILEQRLKEVDDRYELVVTFDTDYTA